MMMAPSKALQAPIHAPAHRRDEARRQPPRFKLSLLIGRLVACPHPPSFSSLPRLHYLYSYTAHRTPSLSLSPPDRLLPSASVRTSPAHRPPRRHVRLPFPPPSFDHFTPGLELASSARLSEYSFLLWSSASHRVAPA
ncbi:hypothetical protein PVAP13_9KG511226 [Panicum virgatum]|uniref:Uncharacterized protein n=1 Tax=Panicum virgatum TaxID=38727 RepID=A0A8T0NT61_PANVG|nr:hypothetical protein PVAP13_9KG511226 [Panicum virgatum]